MERTSLPLPLSSFPRIAYTRNYLSSHRRHLVDTHQEFDKSRQTVDSFGLGRRLRGRRAGRPRRKVQQRVYYCHTLSTNSNCLDDELNWQIPIIKSSARQLPSDIAVRSVILPSTRSPVYIDCSVDRTRQCRSVKPPNHTPTFFVLNPTSIAKPHAFDQLMVDVVSFNADVVVIL